MYVCMHACMHACMDGWMYVCMYVCMYVLHHPKFGLLLEICKALQNPQNAIPRPTRSPDRMPSQQVEVVSSGS